MDYDTALANSKWALKVTEIEELRSDPPRPSREFLIEATFLKGNWMTLDEYVGTDAIYLLYTNQSFQRRVRLEVGLPFRIKPHEASLVARDEGILDLLTDDSGELLDAAILPDSSVEREASVPRQGLPDSDLADEEFEEDARRFSEQVVSLGDRAFIPAQVDSESQDP